MNNGLGMPDQHPGQAQQQPGYISDYYKQKNTSKENLHAA